MSHNAKCSRCLLDDGFPGVAIAENGLCTKCNTHDQVYGDWAAQADERRSVLQGVVERAKAQRRQYDAVVGLSGGKDSTYALLYAKEELGLDCVAVTFDNGLLAEAAKDNIRAITEQLGVTHIFVAPSRPVLRGLYRGLMERTGHFCPICMGGIATAVAAMVLAFDAPLLIQATSRRTEELVSRAYFIHGDLTFVYDALSDDTELAQSAERFIWNPRSGDQGRFDARLEADRLFRDSGGRAGLPFPLLLPDYIDWDARAIPAILEARIGWKHHGDNALAAEHMDCAAHPLVDYLRHRKFPSLQPEKLKYSALVSAGLMTREEAEAALADRRTDPVEPAGLDALLDRIGIDRDLVAHALADPLQHLRYRVPDDV